MSRTAKTVNREFLTRNPSGEISRHHEPDAVAIEQPLEIRVEGRSVAVVMRTPGHDEELVAGFLVTEGVVSRPEDIFEISLCPNLEAENEINLADVLLRKNTEFDLESLTRHVFSSSSCGICGKATIESVFQSFPPLENNESSLPAATLLELPGRLRAAQETFEETGGLHASALFNAGGELQLIREDVGRHNALDKIVGRSFLHSNLPLAASLLLLSGRISFELVQKALAAGIPVIAGISAPSSLAIDFARESNQTLVGFLREERMNIYTGPERIT
ncbi:MAG: formate dehydrogenase accessory sulfurtransferase FdhD [Verrucomicrobiales bacterium]